LACLPGGQRQGLVELAVAEERCCGGLKDARSAARRGKGNMGGRAGRRLQAARGGRPVGRAPGEAGRWHRLGASAGMGRGEQLHTGLGVLRESTQRTYKPTRPLPKYRLDCGEYGRGLPKVFGYLGPFVSLRNSGHSGANVIIDTPHRKEGVHCLSSNGGGGARKRWAFFSVRMGSGPRTPGAKDTRAGAVNNGPARGSG